MADSSKVEVPRTAFIALIVALLLALLALTFILGRMSAAPATLPAPTPSVSLPVAQGGRPATSERGGPGVLITSTRPRHPRPAGSSEPEAPVDQESPSLPDATPVPSGRETVHIASAGHPDPTQKEPRQRNPEVLAYLQQVDALTSGTDDLGDLNDFATKLLGQASLGDTSGFDSLLAKVRKARAQLGKIHPPAPCKEHYRLTEAQLQGSQALLEALKKSMVDMDTTSLTGLAARGQTMQAQAKRLETLTLQLKNRYR